MLRKLAVAGTALVLCSVSALAADLPAKAAPIAPTAFNWSGFYLGINGGGATGRVNWNADGFGNEGSHDPSGGTFGGQVGYRWQTPSSWVFGVEAQGNWSDFKGSSTSLLFPGQTNTSKIDSFGRGFFLSRPCKCAICACGRRDRLRLDWSLHRCQRRWRYRPRQLECGWLRRRG